MMIRGASSGFRPRRRHLASIAARDRMTNESEDLQAVERLGKARDAIVAELRKTIVGMDDVIDEMMIADLRARPFACSVGVPGLAKTLLVSSLAQTMSLSFKRIQFTPDLMPSDITGTELLQEDPETPPAPGSSSRRGRSSPTCCSRTRSTERRRRRRQLFWRLCRRNAISSGGQSSIRARRAVLRAGDAESDRAGGHLPAAGSAARPVPLQHHGQVSEPFTEELDIMRSVTGDDGARAAKRSWMRPVDPRVPAPGPAHSGRPSTFSTATRRRWSGLDAARRSPTRPISCKQDDGLGSGTACIAGTSSWPARPGLPCAGGATFPMEDVQRAVRLPVLRHRVIPNFAARSEGHDLRHPDREAPRRGADGREAPRAARLDRVGSTPFRHVRTPAPHLLPRPRGAAEARTTWSSIAREAVEGLRVGSHRSPLRGFSTEFAHHRQYAPGDALRDRSTGACSVVRIATTPSSTRPRPTSTARSSSMRARR